MKLVTYMVDDPAAVDEEFFYLKKSDAFKHAKNVASLGTASWVTQYEIDLKKGKDLRLMLVNLINRQDWGAVVTVLRAYYPNKLSPMTKRYSVRMVRETEAAVSGKEYLDSLKSDLDGEIDEDEDVDIREPSDLNDVVPPELASPTLIKSTDKLVPDTVYMLTKAYGGLGPL